MKKYTGAFYCFSPPVMVATLVIEAVLAVYAIAKYRKTAVSKLVIALLLLLAAFQLAEFNVCKDFDRAWWSAAGFIFITWLPVLGFHLILQLAKKGNKLVLGFAYLSAVACSLMVLVPQFFISHQCTGNYVIFTLDQSAGLAYFAFYYGWLLAGLALCLHYAVDAPRKIRIALLGQAAGYLVFIIPTAIVNTLRPETINGLPSIMCGFAVLYAGILVWVVLPNAVPTKS